MCGWCSLATGGDLIKLSGFMICSSTAAMSGIVSASYTGNVSPGSGGGHTLLVAAAVIGGLVIATSRRRPSAMGA